MVGIEYRLFFNNSPGTQEQLDRIDDIVVDQEVDMTWEARIKIPVFLDDKGYWTGVDEEFMKSFSRIRVEVKVGDKVFVPLIDGSIVGTNSPLDFEPGKSFIDLIVHDDSIYLNQEEKIRQFNDMKDDEIASQIIQENTHIFSSDIETTIQKSPIPVVIQHGTDIQLLRTLSKRNGMHSYILPGSNPGQSIGCFKSFPIKDDGLAALKLLGPDHNMVSFKITKDYTKPSKIKSFYLDMTDKSISEYNASFVDVPKLGPDSPIENDRFITSTILNPFENISSSNPAEQIGISKAIESSYALEATGIVLENSYPGVLRPYRVVSILGANPRQSGDFLIIKVTHTLSRDSYSQSFTVIRNALSTGSSNSSNSLAGIGGTIF